MLCFACWVLVFVCVFMCRILNENRMETGWKPDRNPYFTLTKQVTCMRHTLTHSHSDTLTLTHTHTYSHTLRHTHSLVHSHSLTDIQTLTHSHTLTHTYTHSHTHTLTLTPVSTHAHSHTHALRHISPNKTHSSSQRRTKNKFKLNGLVINARVC